MDHNLFAILINAGFRVISLRLYLIFVSLKHIRSPVDGRGHYTGPWLVDFSEDSDWYAGPLHIRGAEAIDIKHGLHFDIVLTFY
jgi:hypothetical protein